MAVEAEQFLHLARPIAPATPGYNVNFSPMTVHIQPQAVMSILDHATRRDIRDPLPSASTTNTASATPDAASAEPKPVSRVIGALIGTRSEDGSEIEVRNCFAIPHTETEDQVEVDVDYQRTMLAMTLKASPRETLLGWYTTSLELNSFSALIQNFFASPETGTFPHPAIHLTISTTPGQPIATRCYISAPSAVNADHAAESCLFIQVPHDLSQGDAGERAALETISAAAADPKSRTAPVVSDIEGLARAIETTTDLLERASNYVSEVLDEEKTPNQALGQYLMNNLSLAPKVDAESVERDFNNHVQDVLMVSYLANTIRTQIDLAQRLATSALINEHKEDGKKDGEGEKGGDRGDRGGRGGKRGGMRGGKSATQREPRENGEGGNRTVAWAD